MGRIPGGARWTFVVAIAAIGMLTSTIVSPPSIAVPGPVGSGAFLHVTGYFGFALAVAYALAPYRAPARTKLLLAFLLPVCFGAMMEVAQSFFAHRVMSVEDVFANAAGAGAAVVGWHLLSVRFDGTPAGQGSTG